MVTSSARLFNHRCLRRRSISYSCCSWSSCSKLGSTLILTSLFISSWTFPLCSSYPIHLDLLSARTTGNIFGKVHSCRSLLAEELLSPSHSSKTHSDWYWIWFCARSSCICPPNCLQLARSAPGTLHPIYWSVHSPACSHRPLWTISQLSYFSYPQSQCTLRWYYHILAQRDHAVGRNSDA